MKYLYALAAAVVGIVHSSCSTLKERNSSHQRHVATEQAGSSLYQSQYDSAGRYWYFWTDSLFYYHPDSGLYAYKGALAVQESRVHQDVSIWAQDSSSYALDESSTSDYKSTPVSGRKLIWLIVILGGMVFLFFLVSVYLL